ncbi:MAG: acyl dehydratase [Myxococcota bacterium]|jgi:acyl dehydratase
MYPIGKTYPGPAHTITAEESAAYASATSDPSPEYVGPDAVCPPMLHVKLLLPVMEAIAGDPELALDMLRLVHGEHDATFHRPLRPGDRIETSAILSEVTEKRSGLLVVGQLSAHCGGDLVTSARTAYFIRAPATSKPKSKSKPPPAAPPPPPDLVVDWAVGADQSHRYAAASGDRNPIHTDASVAAAAGLPSVILHGLCTMAMAGRSVTDAVGASPRELHRLGVRFAGLVFNGATLQTRIWHGPTRDHRFAVFDGPRPVITSGIAEFRPC